MQRISIFDPSYVTGNIGDQIILEAVIKYLREIFAEGFFTGIPTHDYPNKSSFAHLAQHDFAFVGGTNILSSHWLWYHQWKIRLTDLKKAGQPILMGVGWHKYQRDPDPITKLIFKTLLHKKKLHSLRDIYTHDKLKKNGFENVIYTGCPTMWELTDSHIASIKTTRSRKVVFTLTAYLKRDENDRAFIRKLVENYDEVSFWPQMYDDLAYLRSICDYPVKIIQPSLAAVKETFRQGDTDYVGMRLHCGVLALQSGVRALILKVDNRATEISKNTNLPTLERNDLAGLQRWIDEGAEIKLTMPFDNIATWKDQFRDAAQA